MILPKQGGVSSRIGQMKGSEAKRIFKQTRECRECGKEFVPKKDNQEFCEKPCYQVWYRKNVLQRTSEKIDGRYEFKERDGDLMRKMALKFDRLVNNNKKVKWDESTKIKEREK